MDPDKYPQTNQPETAQQPNPFEGMSSIEEVLPEYQRLMGEVADEHQRNFAQAPEPARVAGLLAETSDRVGGILGAVAKTIEPMLDRESRRSLSDIRNGAYIYGMSSDMVKPKLDTASPAVRAILDAEVLSGAQAVKVEYKEDVLAAASSPSTRGAIRAALDLVRLERARKAVREGVPADMNRELEAATTPDVAAALEHTVRAEQRPPTDQRGSLFNVESRDGDLTPEDIMRDLLGTGILYEAVLGNRKPHSRSNGNKPPAQSEESAQERAPQTDETTKIIDSAIAVNDKVGWLKQDPDFVKATIARVRKRRSEGFSDDQISREDRLAADRGDPDDPEATKRVMVMDALKNGPKGTLDF